jgi:hypothetical protein
VRDLTPGVDGDTMLAPPTLTVRVFSKQPKPFDCHPKDVFTTKSDQA